MHKDNALTATKRISQNQIAIMKTFSRFTDTRRRGPWEDMWNGG